MTDSTSRAAVRKPAKLDPNWRIKRGLHPQFPLFPHQSGRWAKKVRGQLKYFGYVEDDPRGEKAIGLWNDQKDDLIAGRVPRDKSTIVTVADVCNRFMSAKLDQVGLGTLTSRSFVEYRGTTDLLVATFGRNRSVDDLGPDDFTKLYSTLTKKHTVSTIGREITHVRSVFKFAAESDLLQRIIKYGPVFKSPKKSDKRKARAALQHKYGKRLFTAAELKAMIESAGPQLKAMFLLAINCGYGNTDCSNLPLSALDLQGGWADYPRPKTGIDRRCPLWPETVEAVNSVIAARKQPKNRDYAGLVFLTEKRRQPWVRFELVETTDDAGKRELSGKADDAIAKETRKLLNNLNIYRRGLSFYTLRHTFETIAGGARDQVAVDHCMGHIDASMAAEYREHIDDERLRAVTNHVRSWLYPPEPPTKPEGG